VSDEKTTKKDLQHRKGINWKRNNIRTIVISSCSGFLMSPLIVAQCALSGGLRRYDMNGRFQMQEEKTGFR
jgi:hypothetical protein